jgi:predicted MFS family arabinose efflux permease
MELLIPADIASRRPILTALALSLGTAVSLGMARFAYALLLPPMRIDLGWSYLLAGGMNTSNALGYFIGAMMTPPAIRRFGPYQTFIAGSIITALFMLLSGFVTDAYLLLLQRLLAGIASAFTLISGAVLAAQLGSMHTSRAGLLIGLYYGGTGIGITASALLVPAALAFASNHGAVHAWQSAWLGLGALCLLATLAMAHPTRQICAPSTPSKASHGFKMRPFAYGLASYLMFGIGYIGYMTFVIALLREQHMSSAMITAFYALLGIAAVASSRIWAGMLDRFKGGESLAILSALLAMAILLPVVTVAFIPAFISGILFGAVFLSLVASTTALVRHNLPADAWSSGISVFTIAFALGQIIGPTIVGWIADGPGGLKRGMLFSSAILFIGAILAARQKPLQISTTLA